MADTNPQVNRRPTPLERANEAVVRKYPRIYVPGIRTILDAIPAEVLHAYADEKQMTGERT